MNIGEASRHTGLPVKTIRYYDEIGLVTADRGGNGYRDFDDVQITRLRFLARARRLGFSLDECRRLIGLYCDPNRASRDVRTLAADHLVQLRQKIDELRALEVMLENLIADCPGDDSPDCVILGQLAAGGDQPGGGG